MCDNRYFNQDLHFTVNLKSGDHNVETLKKCFLQVALKVFRYVFISYSVSYVQNQYIRLSWGNNLYLKINCRYCVTFCYYNKFVVYYTL